LCVSASRVSLSFYLNTLDFHETGFNCNQFERRNCYSFADFGLMAQLDSHAAFLSAAPAKHTESSDYYLGTTVDQIAAKEIGRQTRLASLELAMDLNPLAGVCNNGYACVYQNCLSWSSPTTPLPSEAHPRVVFERLFGEGGNAADRQAAADAEQNPNVLPPRPGGVLAALAARPDLGIVVIAHTGLEDLVSPGQVWAALPLYQRPMTVRWWYVPPGTVPSDPAEQFQWLRVQWALVDSWIGARIAQSGVPDAAEAVVPGVPGPAAGQVGEVARPGEEPSPETNPLLDTPS